MNDLTKYLAIRSQMRPGDVIAFAGRAAISYAIDAFSGSILSHVGFVNQAAPGSDVTLSESTIEGALSGPQTHPLGEVLANYGDGARAWWLPLAEEDRAMIDWTRFYAAIGALEGHVSYDKPGLFGFLVRDIPVLGARIMQGESDSRMFCSGYLTDVFERSGLLRGINYSKTTPQDVAEMRLYSAAVQLIGSPATIARFNTL